MPIRFCISWAACAVLCLSIRAAKPPLAFAAAPACSKRPGVRAVRSDLVQMGAVTASVSAQAVREGDSCLQSAALWVTEKGISQQYEMRDAATNTFGILDIAPDSSAILLSSIATFAKPGDDHSAQLAIVNLADGTLKWTPVAELLNLKSCDAIYEPQGFLDSTHVLITALPRISAKHPTCVTAPVYFSYDVTHRAVKYSAAAGIHRYAQSVSGPIQSCKSDPDVVAACYTARARLSVMDDPEGMIVWPVGAAHVMSVAEGMLPGNLSSRVSPNMRVYATMVICPLAVEPGPHPHICVDAATEFHSDPLPVKAVHGATSRPAGVNGQSH